jgi:hypothetical protein
MFSNKSFVVAIALVLLLVGCGSYSERALMSAESAIPAPALEPDSPPAARYSAFNKTAAQGTVLAALAAPATNRQLIKTATLSMEVTDAPAVAQSIAEKATLLGGYVSDTKQRKVGDNRFQISLSARIPADKFDQTAQDIMALGTVLDYNASAQDVTEEYVDTDSRARNLKQTEERILEHLQRSAVLEDILKVEQELTRIRGQIEELDGRLRYLDNRVDFSTINITLVDTPRIEPIAPPEAYSPGQIASQELRSLLIFGRKALNVGIRLGVWTPVWLPLLIILLLMIRLAKKHSSQAGK